MSFPTINFDLFLTFRAWVTHETIARVARIASALVRFAIGQATGVSMTIVQHVTLFRKDFAYTCVAVAEESEFKRS